ncbi:MAG: hypothetical protein WAM14_03440 [Candidatus Nitrosopolaris sp.]
MEVFTKRDLNWLRADLKSAHERKMYEAERIIDETIKRIEGSK